MNAEEALRWALGTDTELPEGLLNSLSYDPYEIASLPPGELRDRVQQRLDTNVRQAEAISQQEEAETFEINTDGSVCDCEPGKPCGLKVYQIADNKNSKRFVDWPVKDGAGNVPCMNCKDPLNGKLSAEVKIHKIDRVDCEQAALIPVAYGSYPNIKTADFAGDNPRVTTTTVLRVASPFQLPAPGDGLLPRELAVAIYVLGLAVSASTYRNMDAPSAEAAQCVALAGGGTKVFPLPHLKLTGSVSGVVCIKFRMSRMPEPSGTLKGSTTAEVGNRAVKWSGENSRSYLSPAAQGPQQKAESMSYSAEHGAPITIGNAINIPVELARVNQTFAGQCKFTGKIVAEATLELKTWLFDASASAGAEIRTDWHFGLRRSSGANGGLEKLYHFEGLILRAYATAPISSKYEPDDRGRLDDRPPLDLPIKVEVGNNVRVTSNLGEPDIVVNLIAPVGGKMVGQPLKMHRRIFLLSLAGVTATGLKPIYAYAEDATHMTIMPVTGTVTAENAFVSVFVNGAPFCLSGAVREVLFTYPILSILREGENRIDFDYEPFNKPLGTYTPHDGVRVGFDVSVLGGRKITPLAAQYSEAEAAMLPSDHSLLTGAPTLGGDSNTSAGGTFSVEPSAIQFRSSLSSENVERISTRFQINMPGLGDVAWAGSENLISDPEIQEELYAAYQILHRLLETNNIDGFIELARPLLLRTALANGYQDERSVADRVFELNPMGRKPGSQMAPLMSWSEFQAQPLRWGSTGQLVASFDDPIKYVDVSSGERTGGMRVFFARLPGEAMKICYSIDSGQ